MSEAKSEGVQGALMSPEKDKTPKIGAEPKIPTGKFIKQLKAIDERGRPQMVNIYAPPTEEDGAGNEIDKDVRGYGYLVTDNETGEEVVWDLDQRELKEPDVYSYVKRGVSYRGSVSPKTQDELNERARLRESRKFSLKFRR